ncbi:MAG TPA: hypothetical protein VGW80_01150 [Solirubrobacterales bacterium]|jgi:hypothetical protein|nr:hypothetical protein [Solirubrobacterales bacterium]
MSRVIWRQAPALVVAAVALVAALAGTVYAAAKINGHAIKVKSLPGNRLAPHSVPANRLKPGTIPNVQLAPGSIQGDRLAPGSVTGLQVDVSTLGQVPSAFHAETAESAKDAETALNAANAVNAQTVNGYHVGCKPGTRLFAGACWQIAANSSALNPAAAAATCANEGGELPSPLLLAAFSQQPGITLAAGDEWTGDIPVVSGSNVYAVTTVSASAAINSSPASNTRRFRCVIPLLS